MSNPNDPFPVPPESAPPPGQPPYGDPPPYGAPPLQQPYGAPPHQPPYGAPPQPPYGAAPANNSKLLIGIIAGLVLVIVVGATLYFTGAFGGSRRDYSIAAPGQAPALTREFLIGGTWREACGTSGHMEFDVSGTFVMNPPPGRGNWTLSGGGVSATVEGRTTQLTIQPLGSDTMRVTADGQTKTLIRCDFGQN